MDYAFYFFFWVLIFWMIAYTFAAVFGALNFNWLVVLACAALFAYGTVWLNKMGS